MSYGWTDVEAYYFPVLKNKLPHLRQRRLITIAGALIEHDEQDMEAKTDADYNTSHRILAYDYDHDLGLAPIYLVCLAFSPSFSIRRTVPISACP